jgi:hypothetical protein
MSNMQWHRISHGGAASADDPQNLSSAVQGMRWQGTDNRGRQLGQRYSHSGVFTYRGAIDRVSPRQVFLGRLREGLYPHRVGALARETEGLFCPFPII